MTYASLRSFSYFTFTLNQLLTPDTREYVYTKIWASHRYSFWCRSADFEICLCVIIALQFAQSYLMSAMKPCTYSQLIERVLVPASVWLAMVRPWVFTEKRQKKILKSGWPWFGHGVFTEKRQKKILKSWPTMVGQSTMVNHGWPFKWSFWNHLIISTSFLVQSTLNRAWLTMVWQSFFKP